MSSINIKQYNFVYSPSGVRYNPLSLKKYYITDDARLAQNNTSFFYRNDIICCKQIHENVLCYNIISYNIYDEICILKSLLHKICNMNYFIDTYTKFIQNILKYECDSHIQHYFYCIFNNHFKTNKEKYNYKIKYPQIGLFEKKHKQVIELFVYIKKINVLLTEVKIKCYHLINCISFMCYIQNLETSLLVIPYIFLMITFFLKKQYFLVHWIFRSYLVPIYFNYDYILPCKLRDINTLGQLLQKNYEYFFCLIMKSVKQREQNNEFFNNCLEKKHLATRQKNIIQKLLHQQPDSSILKNKFLKTNKEFETCQRTLEGLTRTQQCKEYQINKDVEDLFQLCEQSKKKLEYINNLPIKEYYENICKKLMYEEHTKIINDSIIFNFIPDYLRDSSKDYYKPYVQLAFITKEKIKHRKIQPKNKHLLSNETTFDNIYKKIIMNEEVQHIHESYLKILIENQQRQLIHLEQIEQVHKQQQRNKKLLKKNRKKQRKKERKLVQENFNHQQKIIIKLQQQRTHFLLTKYTRIWINYTRSNIKSKTLCQFVNKIESFCKYITPKNISFIDPDKRLIEGLENLRLSRIIMSKHHQYDIFNRMKDIGLDIINRLQNFLQQISVKCILTGGFAVSIHSNLYQTTDIDIKICPDKDYLPFKGSIKVLRDIITTFLFHCEPYTKKISYLPAPLLEFGSFQKMSTNNDGALPIKIMIPKINYSYHKPKTTYLEFIDITFSESLQGSACLGSYDKLLYEDYFLKKCNYRNLLCNEESSYFSLTNKPNLIKHIQQHLLPQLKYDQYKHKEGSWKNQLQTLCI